MSSIIKSIRIIHSNNVIENSYILAILVGFLYFALILASKLTAIIMTNEPIQKFRLGTLSQKNQSQMLEKITPVKAKGVMTLAGAYLKARVSNNWKIRPNPPTKK